MRKNYRDGICCERLRANKGSSFDEVDYTGDLTPTLHPMALVQSARLEVGQTLGYRFFRLKRPSGATMNGRMEVKLPFSEFIEIIFVLGNHYD